MRYHAAPWSAGCSCVRPFCHTPVISSTDIP
nr:MAG TPA: hypothetical protein [Caudoviricetes sp.]